MTMTKTRLLIATAAATFPLSGWAADDLSYTYAEIDYANLDVDEFDDDNDVVEDFDDGDGWAINGSFAFTPNIFAFAGYSETNSDVTFSSGDTTPFTSDEDIKRFDVGLGYNMDLDVGFLEQADLVLRAAYSDIDLGDFDFGATDSSSFDDLDDDSSDGWFTDASLRSQLVPWLEAAAGVRYTDIDDAENIGLVGNLLFEINPNLGVNLGLEASDEIGMYYAGLRYSFARM